MWTMVIILADGTIREYYNVSEEIALGMLIKVTSLWGRQVAALECTCDDTGEQINYRAASGVGALDPSRN